MKDEIYLLSCRLREPDRGAASCPEQTARQAFAGGPVCAVAASGSPPAASISGITVEDAFKGTLPYFLSSILVLALLVLFPMAWLALPAMLFPGLF